MFLLEKWLEIVIWFFVGERLLFLCLDKVLF